MRDMDNANDFADFFEFREKMNNKLLTEGNLDLKRFFNLDNSVYRDGLLSARNKELMGLVASLVLKCDQCVFYHLDRCHQKGVSRDELYEVFSIALTVGGSIVIPHLRNAVDFLDKLEQENQNKQIKKANEKRKAVDEKINKEIEIYTDGACSGNPGPGGYAAIIYQGDSQKEISGFVKDTTNNRMEITAVIKALEVVGAASKIKIYSDSDYLIKGICQWIKKWKKNNWLTSGKKDVKNRDLWQKLDNLVSEKNVEFIKVKAHSENKKNQQVDKIARKKIKDNK